MERIWKLLLLALVAAEVALVWSGVISLGAAVGIVAAVEVALVLVASRQIVVGVRRYRRDRSKGLDAWSALEDGLSTLVPRPLARLVALEPQLWGCLAIWLLRRHKPGPAEFAYSKHSMLGVLLVVVLFTTPVEPLLFELLIPWTWLRYLLLAAGAYAVVLVLALYASVAVLPHRLEADAVRLFYGAFADARIPYQDIKQVEVARRRPPGGGEGHTTAQKEDAVYLAVGGRTDLTLHLKAGHVVHGRLRPTPPVRAIHLAVDEPDRLAREIKRRIGAAS